MSASQAERGFTLVEVLVAFVILVTMAGTLMRFISDGLNRTGRGESELALAAAAERSLAMIGAEIPYGAGEQPLSPVEGYTGRVRMQPVTAALNGDIVTDPVWSVVVTVWPQDQAPAQGITLATVRFGAAGQ